MLPQLHRLCMITIITNLSLDIVALSFIWIIQNNNSLSSDHDHHEMKEWLFTNDSIVKD